MWCHNLHYRIRPLPTVRPSRSNFDPALNFMMASRSTSFFFNDPATTKIYTLSLHDALPILPPLVFTGPPICTAAPPAGSLVAPVIRLRSEEHTSELQSPCNLVCRLLLE